jgi:hypothetical protein
MRPTRALAVGEAESCLCRLLQRAVTAAFKFQRESAGGRVRPGHHGFDATHDIRVGNPNSSIRAAGSFATTFT